MTAKIEETILLEQTDDDGAVTERIVRLVYTPPTVLPQRAPGAPGDVFAFAPSRHAASRAVDDAVTATDKLSPGVEYDRTVDDFVTATDQVTAKLEGTPMPDIGDDPRIKPATLVDLRRVWRPKMKEVERACVSCPFRIGNEEAFAAVVVRLRRVFKQDELPLFDLHMAAAEARKRVAEDVNRVGDFACHNTAYYPDGSERPESDRRQCKGASLYYRTAGDPNAGALLDDIDEE